MVLMEGSPGALGPCAGSFSKRFPRLIGTYSGTW